MKLSAKIGNIEIKFENEQDLKTKITAELDKINKSFTELETEYKELKKQKNLLKELDVIHWQFLLAHHTEFINLKVCQS